MTGRFAVLYSEGVASHSPGLPRFAATLGTSGLRNTYPNGVATYGKLDATPLGISVKYFETVKTEVYADLGI